MRKFLISVLMVVVIALYFPTIGIKIREFKMLKIGIFLTFLITGIELQVKNAIREISNPYNIMAIILSFLVFFPIISFLLSKLLLDNFTEIKFGVYILSLSPATIASGTILTRMAKGNITLSLLICVFTNIIVLFTIPIFLKFFLIIERVSINISLYDTTNNLIYTVLVPILLGQILQVKVNGIKSFLEKQHSCLSKFYQSIILLIIFNAVSRSRLELFHIGFEVIHIFLFMILLHLTAILVNYGLSKIINLNYVSMKAFVIHASQKTLTIPYVIWADYFYNDFPSAIIPAIVYHIVQTTLDPLLANYFANQSNK